MNFWNIIISYYRVCLRQSNLSSLEDASRKRKSIQFDFPTSREISVVLLVSIEACFNSEVKNKMDFLKPVSKLIFVRDNIFLG